MVLILVLLNKEYMLCIRDERIDELTMDPTQSCKPYEDFADMLEKA